MGLIDEFAFALPGGFLFRFDPHELLFPFSFPLMGYGVAVLILASLFQEVDYDGGIRMGRFARVAMMGFAWVCFAVGCVGVFVPVLPTTPLLLLATFLFARSSDRCHRWICSTKVYRNYVAAFKQAGGMTLASKTRMLAVSYAVLAVSAVAV